jgi:hypothetical protein
VDEFISINVDIVSHAQELFCRPGSILCIVKRYSEPTNSTKNATLHESVGSHDSTVTMTKEPKYWFKLFQQSCCIALPQVLYSAVKSNDDDAAQGVPSILLRMPSSLTLFGGITREHHLKECAMALSANPMSSDI